MDAATLGLGLKVGSEIIDRIAAGWGGGNLKDHIGEQAGLYAEELIKRRDAGAAYLPDNKAEIFREKFPEAAEFLDVAMERDEGISFLIIFLKGVQAKFDNPKNNG